MKDAVAALRGSLLSYQKQLAALVRDGRIYGRGTSDDKGGFLAENESLHLGDWQKAMVSAVHLFHELADFQ